MRALVYLIAGVLLSLLLRAVGAGHLDPLGDHSLLREACDVALIVSVFASGLAVERRVARSSWRLIGVLLVFWWGFGLLPKLFVIVLICFFPVLVTTVDGLASVDRDQLKLLRTLGASRWQALRFGELPAAVPAALSGARIALTVAVIGAYIAETSTATYGRYAGLGHQINADINALQTPRAYAAAVVLFLFAIVCFYTLALAERLLAPWANRPRGESR